MLFWSHFWMMFLYIYSLCWIKISICFLDDIFSYCYFECLKIAENNTSAEYNPGENVDFEGYSNDDIGDNESIVPDSDPDSSDIEVPFVESSKVSSDITDFRNEKDDRGPNNVTDATDTANGNIPN